MPNKDESLNDDQDEVLEDDSVETSQEEDETLDDANDDDAEEDNDDDQDDDSEDDDDSEEDDSEDAESEFKKRYSNIKGDTPEEYAQNLEEAYSKSSREAKRLVQEDKKKQDELDSLRAIINADPKLKEAVEKAAGQGASPLVDPVILQAREEMNRKMEADYAAFATVHPEIDTDEELQEQVLEEVAMLGEMYRKKGKTLSMEKALKRAWTNLGLDEEDAKDKVTSKAKETASKSKNNSSNKKRTKAPTLTAEQIKTAKRMGLTEKDLLENLGK